MTLFILRGAFILLVAAVAALYLLSNQWDAGFDFAAFVLRMGIALVVAAAIVALDVHTRRKRLSALSGIFLGLLAGLLAAYALSFVVDLFAVLTAPEGRLERMAYLNLLEGVKVVIGLITCYLGISLVIQTKDDFRFVIPYVEFAKEVRGNRPTLLDTSVIVDGRVLDIVETGLLQGTLIIPKFVLDELQTIADSGDKLRRARGRRGLEILQKLQDNGLAEVHIDEREAEGAGVDQKLISLAQETQGRVMTNDYNLNKIATLRGVDVVNINDLAKAMRPVVLPGEHMTVRIVKPGESPTQGVGYLEDGTMVVVEGGRRHMTEEVSLVVTSTLQTSAGRMIFGRYEESGNPRPAGGEPADEAQTGPTSEPAQAETTETAPTEAAAGRATSAGARRSASGRNPRRSR